MSSGGVAGGIRLDGAYFTVFLVNRIIIDLRNQQNLPSPSQILATILQVRQTPSEGAGGSWMILFCDTSALLKLYVETGSDAVKLASVPDRLSCRVPASGLPLCGDCQPHPPPSLPLEGGGIYSPPTACEDGTDTFLPLPRGRIYSLPFKGRAGVGMGCYFATKSCHVLTLFNL